MFDWDDARVVLAVQRTGSLLGAGRQLHIDASTVGRRLTALEEVLGARLFDRNPQGLVATSAAERILPRLESIEEEMAGVERELAGRESSLAGTVRLTTPEALGSRFLTPLLAGFRERHPEIELELFADNRTLSLSRREADLALRLARPTQPMLVVRQVALVGSALYGSRRYLAARGRRRGKDFSGHDFVGFDDSFQPDLEVRWLARHARGARFAFRTNSTQVQLSAAVAGLGLALLPCYLADGVAELERLLPPHKVLMRTLWLVLHRDLRRAARIRAVADFLTETLRAEGARLKGGAGPDERAVSGRRARDT